MSNNPGPRPVPAHLLDPLRSELYDEHEREVLDRIDPTRYGIVSRAVQEAYEAGLQANAELYPEAYRRGWQDCLAETERRHRLLAAAENGGNDD